MAKILNHRVPPGLPADPPRRLGFRPPTGIASFGGPGGGPGRVSHFGLPRTPDRFISSLNAATPHLRGVLTREALGNLRQVLKASHAEQIEHLTKTHLRQRTLSLTEIASVEGLLKAKTPASLHPLIDRHFQPFRVGLHSPVEHTRMSQNLRQYADRVSAHFLALQSSLEEISRLEGFLNVNGIWFFSDLAFVLPIRNVVVEAILLILKLEFEWMEKRRKEEAKRQEKEAEENRLVERSREIKSTEKKRIENKRLRSRAEIHLSQTRADAHQQQMRNAEFTLDALKSIQLDIQRFFLRHARETRKSA